MRLDQFDNPIFNENDLFESLYKGDSLTSEVMVDFTPNIKQLEQVSDIRFALPFISNSNIGVEDFDRAMQQDWFVPDEYKDMDIIKFILDKCPLENLDRVNEELTEFISRNMLDVLRWLKYFVDTCTSNDIVWGVGRGSSVASYVLYLLGVHRIDSIKYNLDWREFLR